MSRRENRRDDVVAFQVGGLKGLSKTAAQFVRRRPREARLAVTAALEAAAVQFESSHESEQRTIPAALRRFGRFAPTADDTIGVAAAAKRLHVSRTTVYDWIKKKRMIAWKTSKRGMAIPAEQIVGPGELVPGLEQVLAIIRDGRAAWRFLNEESPFFDQCRRPIDALRTGDKAAVSAAARAHGEAFT